MVPLCPNSQTPYLVSSRGDCVVCLGSAEFSGLPVQREIPSLGMVTAPFGFLQIRQVHLLLAVDLFRLVPRSSPSVLLCENGRYRCLGSGCLFHSLVACIPSVCSSSDSREGRVRSEASLLLIAPFWPKRPWFPRLLSLLAGQPRSLPVFPGLLRQPISLTQHPNPGVLHLTLWPLSAQPGGRQAFLSGLPNSQPRISDPRREQFMIPDSGHLSSGVPLIRLTHIMPL